MKVISMILLAVSLFAQSGEWVQTTRVSIKALKALGAPGIPSDAKDQIQVLLRDAAGPRPAYIVRIEGKRNGADWSAEQTVAKFPDGHFGAGHAMAVFFVDDEKSIVIQRITVTALGPVGESVHE